MPFLSPLFASSDFSRPGELVRPQYSWPPFSLLSSPSPPRSLSLYYPLSSISSPSSFTLWSKQGREALPSIPYLWSALSKIFSQFCTVTYLFGASYNASWQLKSLRNKTRKKNCICFISMKSSLGNAVFSEKHTDISRRTYGQLLWPIIRGVGSTKVIRCNPCPQGTDNLVWKIESYD